MAKTYYFMRIKRHGFDQLIGVHAIHHVEYRVSVDDAPNCRSELVVWFSDAEDADMVVMYGAEADVAWDAFNELTIRAVLVSKG